MRVGACILLMNGLCFQSYGWQRQRPLGGLQHAVSALEAYQIDEIAIIRPVRELDDKDSLQADIRLLQDLKTMTPISFGGGIRSAEDLDALVNLPIERLVFSSAYIQQDSDFITAATLLYGRQALQALLPVRKNDEKILVYHCQENQWRALTDSCLEFCAEHANEIILYDTKNEGVADAFDWNLPGALHLNRNQLIISGGIGEDTAHRAKVDEYAAVLVENRILHHEYSVGRYKHA